MIASAADGHASSFRASPARHLIAEINTTQYKRLNSIYLEAATISYNLWTRRTTMKVFTLQELGQPTFNVDSTWQRPHNLVHYDEHDDKMKGRSVKVIVHPVLKVYGTDEGLDYDSNIRVWAKAEVWLDSK